MPITDLPVARVQPALEQGATYIDVRSTEEFNSGHAPGALHMPLLDADEDTGQLMPNPDFVRMMKAAFAPDAPLLLGCQSGRRSARAAQILETFGFVNLTSVIGGFAEWQAQDLPVEVSPSDYARRLADIDR